MNLWIRIGVPIGVSMLVFAYVTRLIMRGSSLMHRRLISETLATASRRHSGEIAESTEHCCDIPALPTTLRLSPRSPRLTLTAQGFTFGGIFRRRFVPWSIVQNFEVPRGTGYNISISGADPYGLSNRVAWRYLPGVVNPTPRRTLYATLVGFDGLLPSTYGLSSDGLCKLLNAIRDRYGTPTPKLWGIAKPHR